MNSGLPFNVNQLHLCHTVRDWHMPVSPILGHGHHTVADLGCKLGRECQRARISALPHTTCDLLLAMQVKSIYPLAIIHVLGNVLTNVSLGHVAVSFTHTVKVRHQ